MKKFFTWYFVILKRQLKNISFLTLMIIVPLLTIICTNLSSFKSENNETVLLYARDRDPAAERIIKSLLNSHTEYKYEVAESEEEMKDKIRTRKALCGFAIKENLSKQLKKERYSHNIQFYLRQDSTFSDAANEQVYSKYLKEMSYFLAVDIIQNTTEVSEENGPFNLRDEYEKFLNQDEDGFLNIQFLDETPRTDNVTGNGILMFSIPGVMAVIMLLGTLMGSGNWIIDHMKGTLSPITRGNRFILCFQYIQVPVFLLSISSFITILASKNLVETITLSPAVIGSTLLAVIVYDFILIVLGIVLSYLIKSIEMLIVLEVLSILGSLVLCPIFFDVSMYVRIIKILRIFMPPQWMLLML